jgi:hypothetical protein
MPTTTTATAVFTLALWSTWQQIEATLFVGSSPKEPRQAQPHFYNNTSIFAP